MRTLLLSMMFLLYQYVANAQTSQSKAILSFEDLQQRFNDIKSRSDRTLKEWANFQEKLNPTNKKHSFSVFGGYTENGFSMLGAYSFYNGKNLKNSRNFIEVSLLTSFIEEKQSDYNIPIEIYSLNIGYFKRIPILSGTNRELTTSIGFGGVFGYENINNGDANLQNGALILDESQVIYGGFAGLNTDIHLSDQIDLAAKSIFYYHANSIISNTKFFVGIGIKYSILKNKKQ